MPSIVDAYVSLLPETSRIAPGLRDAVRDAERTLPKVTVEVDADTAKAEAQVDAAARDRKATIEVDADTLNASAQRAFAQMSSSATSAGADIGNSMGKGMHPALMAAGITAWAGIASSASGVLGLIPAALAGAGTSIGTLALGLDGVKDAWDATGKAAEDSGKAQENQAKAVTSAQQALRSAVQDEASAQKDVANARKDARQQLEDLNIQLRGGKLDERQAILDLKAAERDLRTGRFRDSIEYEQAQLRVDQAKQRVIESQDRQNDLQDRANEATAKGVEGADNVVAANQRLAATQQQVANAQASLAEAQNQTSSAADAAATAMANLSPSGQALVQTLQTLKPIWDDFRKSIQEPLLANLGPEITQLAGTYLPMLSGPLQEMSGLLNQAFVGFSDFLQQPETMQSISTILANVNESFRQFQPTMATLSQAFLQLTETGTQYLPQLGQVIDAVAQGFSEFVNSGSLGEWIHIGVQSFQDFVPVAFTVLDIFRELAPIGQALIPALGQILAAIQPAIAPMAETFGSFINVLTPAVELLGHLVSVVEGAVAPAYKQWFDAMTPVMQQLSAALLPVIQQLGPVLGQMAMTLSNVMVQGINTLLPVLIPLVQQMGQWLLAVVPLLPPLVELATSALPMVQQVVAPLLPLVTQLAGLFTNLANTVVPPLVAVIEGLSDTFSARFNIIKTVVETTWNVIKPILDLIKAKINEIADGPLGKILDIGGKLLGGPLGTTLLSGALNGPTTTTGTPVAAAMPGMVVPRQVGSDSGLTPASIGIKGQIAGAFPSITDIGGWRDSDAKQYPNEHVAGKAIDVMIPKDVLGTQQGSWLGDQIASFALRDPNVDYVIWNRQIIRKDGAKPYTGPHPHDDHVHVHTEGGSVPNLASFTPPTPSTSQVTAQSPLPTAVNTAAPVAAAAPSVTGAAMPTTLTRGSSRDQVAQAIIGEAQRRGFSREQTIAVLATAMQESNLNPTASGGGGAWQGIFQQDTSYPGRNDPNSNIGEFFNRLGAPTGDIWSQIFKLQQGTPITASNARTGYLTEIQSKTGAATELYDTLAGKVGVPSMGAFTSPQLGTATSPMYVTYGDGSAFAKQDGGGKELGQNILGGIMEIFGVDGSVFSNLLDTPVFQGFKGVMSMLTKPGPSGQSLLSSVMGGDGAALADPSGGLGAYAQTALGAVKGLTGVQPQPFGEFDVGGRDRRQPSDYHNPQAGSSPGPGNMNDYRIIQNFNGPTSAQQGFNAARDANIPRMRQGMRPLPS